MWSSLERTCPVRLARANIKCARTNNSLERVLSGPEKVRSSEYGSARANCLLEWFGPCSGHFARATYPFAQANCPEMGSGTVLLSSIFSPSYSSFETHFLIKIKGSNPPLYNIQNTIKSHEHSTQIFFVFSFFTILSTHFSN